MKTLISTLFLGGALVLGGCGDNKETKVEQKSELEKYNLVNKSLHEDFLNFCAEASNKKEYAGSVYKIEFPNKDYSIIFDENGSFLDISADTSFHDGKGDGLDNKSSDLFSLRNKNTGAIEVQYIRNLPPEEQLSAAKQYDSLKKKIMHETKHKNY
ncbi:hypothetical protein HYT91_03485 [Candidatus Pacearchaeota archaeon]|nr:hypothetical protein [Candidatus Pacearchaeota archaeon]